MAIQNFVAGGFYGKLGAVVGQRWKNKRTIRTYVIPHNPKTPDQQKNRANFRSSVFYAQLGFQMNWDCTLFIFPGKTKWQARVGVARDLGKSETEVLNLIPVAPVDFVAPYEITQVALAEVKSATEFTAKISGVIPEEARSYSLMLQFMDMKTRATKIMLATGRSSTENPDVLDCICEDTEGLDLGGFALVVSNDDKDSKTDMVLSKRLEIVNEIKVVEPFAVEPIEVSRSGKTFTFTFAQPWQDGENVVYRFEANGISLGNPVTLSAENATLINNGGKFALQIVDTSDGDVATVAFPESSKVEIENIFSLGSDIDYVLPEYEGTLVSEDLVRRGLPPFSIVGDTDKTVRINVNVTVDDRAAEDVTCDLTTNAFYAPVEKTGAPARWEVENNIPVFSCEPYDFPVIMRDDCKISIPSSTFSASGVTYVFEFPENMDFQNVVRVQPFMLPPKISIDGARSIKLQTALLDWTAHPLQDAQVVSKLETVSAYGTGISDNSAFSVSSLEFSENAQTIGGTLAEDAGNFIKGEDYTVFTRQSVGANMSGLTISELGIEYMLPIGTQVVKASWYSLEDFAVAPVAISRSGKTFTLTFAQSYRAAGGSLKNLSLQGISAGNTKTVSIASATLINNGGKFAVQFTDDAANDLAILAFPAGSQLQIAEISSIDGETDYKTTNYTGTVSSTDLSRSGTITPVAVANGTYDFYFETGFTASAAPSGTVTAQRTVNAFFAPTTKSAVSCVWAIVGGKLVLRNASAAQSAIAQFGCTADLPSVGFSEKGVTYTISFTPNVAYKNAVKTGVCTITDARAYCSDYIIEIATSLVGSSAYPIPQINVSLSGSNAQLDGLGDQINAVSGKLSEGSGKGYLEIDLEYEVGEVWESGTVVNLKLGQSSNITLNFPAQGVTYTVQKTVIPCEIDY